MVGSLRALLLLPLLLVLAGCRGGDGNRGARVIGAEAPGVA